MHHEHHGWWSPRLDRWMELQIFGWAGCPVLVFPTSGGRHFEAYDFGIVGALREGLERGWYQLWCVDSVDRESWYNYGAHPGWRSFRHQRFDDYVRFEVVPFIHWKNPNRYLSTLGCSFGAYHAVNFGLKHPDVVRRIMGFSGNYRIDDFVYGHWDDNCYYNSPLAYMHNMGESAYLHHIRSQKIILTAARNDIHACAHGTWELSQVLGHKGVWHDCHIWNDWHHHDWPTWREMARTYV